jgi:hypothetical protein
LTELKINRKALVPSEKQPAAEGQRNAVVVSSRGDKTPLELFLAGVLALNSMLRRVLMMLMQGWGDG